MTEEEKQEVVDILRGSAVSFVNHMMPQILTEEERGDDTTVKKLIETYNIGFISALASYEQIPANVASDILNRIDFKIERS